ncbi:KTSC domain-containing protein [Serratia liquefaciens]|uniref:KTSC domain-containing protein n=1 Tax=Serratia liquefaciens TaxID=614 RepID=UPI0021827EB3|nr:KTSC domain-containing protein [Serratia liquefaciens]CAI2430286.1 Uncharacterised protein [Serratia liquefaciens]
MTPINMTPVESSQIDSIGHNPATNTLAIRFKSKGAPSSLYHYSNVTAEDFAAFSGAESVGSHFYKHIKADTERFPFQRINEKKDDE